MKDQDSKNFKPVGRDDAGATAKGGGKESQSNFHGLGREAGSGDAAKDGGKGWIIPYEETNHGDGRVTGGGVFQVNWSDSPSPPEFAEEAPSDFPGFGTTAKEETGGAAKLPPLTPRPPAPSGGKVRFGGLDDSEWDLVPPPEESEPREDFFRGRDPAGVYHDFETPRTPWWRWISALGSIVTAVMVVLLIWHWWNTKGVQTCRITSDGKAVATPSLLYKWQQRRRARKARVLRRLVRTRVLARQRIPVVRQRPAPALRLPPANRVFPAALRRPVRRRPLVRKPALRPGGVPAVVVRPPVRRRPVGDRFTYPKKYLGQWQPSGKLSKTIRKDRGTWVFKVFADGTNVFWKRGGRKTLKWRLRGEVEKVVTTSQTVVMTVSRGTEVYVVAVTKYSGLVRWKRTSPYLMLDYLAVSQRGKWVRVKIGDDLHKFHLTTGKPLRR